MARAMIGYMEPDGAGEMIYLHYYGDPSLAGVMLARKYNEVDRVRELCRLGFLSTLGPTPDALSWLNTNAATRSYWRDRKEPWQQNAPIRFKRGLEEVAELDWLDARYAYIRTAQGWFVMSDNKVDRPTQGWVPLDSLLPRSKVDEKYQMWINHGYVPPD